MIDVGYPFLYVRLVGHIHTTCLTDVHCPLSPRLVSKIFRYGFRWGHTRRGFGLMAFNATFNTISVISWQSVLLVEKSRVSGGNYRPVASH